MKIEQELLVMFKILFVMFLLVLKLCVVLLDMLKQVTKIFGNNESVPYLAYTIAKGLYNSYQLKLACARSPFFHKCRFSKNSRRTGGGYL